MRPTTLPPSDGCNIRSLFTRRVKVLGLLAHGLSMKKIACELGVPSRTVAFERYRVMTENKLRTGCDVLEFAARSDLLKFFAPDSRSTAQVSRE